MRSTAQRKMAATGWKLPPSPMKRQPRPMATPKLKLRPRRACGGEKTRAPSSTGPRKVASLSNASRSAKRTHRCALRSTRSPALGRVIHFELDRVRRVLEANDFAHLQVDVGIDEVVIEHVAGL